jgi:soluble cytochrome b562
MIDTYDNYVNKVSSKRNKKEKERYSLSTSSLPLILFAKKLIYRKNSGKKPFSIEFNYENNMNIIISNYDEIEKELNNKKIDYSLISKKIDEIASIILKASAEIKMESLRKDFLFLNEQLLLISNNI